jgi:hypothetical protein
LLLQGLRLIEKAKRTIIDRSPSKIESRDGPIRKIFKISTADNDDEGDVHELHELEERLK